MIEVDVKKALLTTDGPITLHVQFKIQEHELVALFGQSGTGKTTILRMIAGLTLPDAGYIKVGGRVWFDACQGINVPVQDRKIGFVFQESTLFPHMSVEENLRFALSDTRDVRMIDEMLALTGLTQLRRRKPHLLSGGERQRVALIRALLRKPQIFLLDEPLSALDLNLRLKLQDELLAMHQRFKIPTIFVSHDLSEVFKLSRRMLWIEDGTITKEGEPEEIFGDPDISGKFRFPGVVLDICQDNFLHIVTIQIGTHLTKVVATANEVDDLGVGDQILVAAKAFNPIIFKCVSQELH